MTPDRLQEIAYEACRSTDGGLYRPADTHAVKAAFSASPAEGCYSNPEG